MEQSTPASLDLAIQAVVQHTDLTETTEIIDAVLASIPQADYERFLRQAIAHRLSSVLGASRSSVTPAIRKGMSTKQSLIRDEYWPAFLQQRVSLPGGVKRMAELTSEDLRFLSAMRRSQANDLLARAEQFDALAEVMDKAKVTYLEQLDSASGSKVLGRAA